MKKIYVGNFSFHMTEPELRALFEPFGALTAHRLLPTATQAGPAVLVLSRCRTMTKQKKQWQR